MKRAVARRGFVGIVAAGILCLSTTSPAAVRTMYDQKSFSHANRAKPAAGRAMYSPRTYAGSRPSAVRPGQPKAIEEKKVTPTQDLRWRPVTLGSLSATAGGPAAVSVLNLLQKPASHWNDALTIDTFNEWFKKRQTSPLRPRSTALPASNLFGQGSPLSHPDN